MKHQSRRRWAALPVVALTLLAGAFQVPTARAGVDAKDADYFGYATGTPVHVDAIETGNTRLVDVEEAFSGAAVASRGLPEIKNEMDRVITGAGNKTSARGTALEVGVAHSPSADNQIILKGVASASSPPSPGHDEQVVGPVNLNPIAYAALLKSTADTRFNDSGACVLGSDLSRGYAFAADAQLLNLGAQNPDGTFGSPVVATDIKPENVTDSISRNRLAPNGAGGFGLVSEARQVIAPITLFRGMPGIEIKIKVAGTWVLRAFAGGNPGNADVHYGPADVSPATPVLIVTVGGSTVATLTTQQLLGNPGLHIPLNLPGLANVDIAVGEPPRAIGGAYGTAPTKAGDGTEASAAVDVVRVTTELLGSVKVEDLRVGHMEAKSKVPAGGIDCPIPVKKGPEGTSVPIGGAFTTTINISNPFDCDLNDVKATDAITGEPFFVVSANEGGNTNGGKGPVTWDLGTIKAGGSKTLTVTVKSIGKRSGTIKDTVTVTGSCGVGSVDGSTTVSVGLTGVGNLTANVGAATAVLGVQLPRTGGPTLLYVAGAILALAGAVFAGRKGLRLVRQNR